MNIALKELRESLVWLKIIERKPLVEPSKMTEVIKEWDELIAIFAASVKTVRQRHFLTTSTIKNEQSSIVIQTS